MYLVVGVPFFLNSQIFIVMCIFPKSFKLGFIPLDFFRPSFKMPFSCMGTVDVLARSMLRHGRCFGVDDVSARSMFRRGQCFGAVDLSAWSMFRWGRCFGAVDVLSWLMLWHGWCFGSVKIIFVRIHHWTEGLPVVVLGSITQKRYNLDTFWHQIFQKQAHFTSKGDLLNYSKTV